MRSQCQSISEWVGRNVINKITHTVKVLLRAKNAHTVSSLVGHPILRQSKLRGTAPKTARSELILQAALSSPCVCLQRRSNNNPAIMWPARLARWSPSFSTNPRMCVRALSNAPIEITTAPTPNPNSLKFLTGGEVMGASGTANFKNASESFASPLAQSLFTVDGITAVFFGPDFIAVTKDDGIEWSDVKPGVSQSISDFYQSEAELMLDTTNVIGSDTMIQAGDDEVVITIKELLNTRIRPAVQEDGGDIMYQGFEHGVVLVQLQGACSGCPSASETLKSGIENMLMHYIPEVKGVSQVLDDEMKLTWQTMD